MITNYGHNIIMIIIILLVVVYMYSEHFPRRTRVVTAVGEGGGGPFVVRGATRVFVVAATTSDALSLQYRGNYYVYLYHNIIFFSRLQLSFFFFYSAVCNIHNNIQIVILLFCFCTINNQNCICN